MIERPPHALVVALLLISCRHSSSEPTIDRHSEFSGACIESEEPLKTATALPKTDPRYAAVEGQVRSMIRYPKKAFVLGVEGTSLLEFCVASDGSIERQPVFIQETPHELLNQEALRAIRAAVPFPTSPEGHYTIRLPIQFQLVGTQPPE